MQGVKAQPGAVGCVRLPKLFVRRRRRSKSPLHKIIPGRSSREEKRILEQAMDEVKGNFKHSDRLIKAAVKTLTEGPSDESVLMAVEVLHRCCYNCSEGARFCVKFDGVGALVDLIMLYPGEIETRTLELLTSLWSINTAAQDAGFRKGAMDTLLRLMSENVSTEERWRALRALTALLKNFGAHQEAFLSQADGVTVLLGCLDCDEDLRVREAAIVTTQNLAANGLLMPQDICRLAGGVLELMARTDDTMEHKERLRSCADALAHVAMRRCRHDLIPTPQARLDLLNCAIELEKAFELSLLRDGVAREDWKHRSSAGDASLVSSRAQRGMGPRLGPIPRGLGPRLGPVPDGLVLRVGPHGGNVYRMPEPVLQPE